MSSSLRSFLPFARPRYAGRIAFREPPDVSALVAALESRGIRYVITGSVAALLHGVPVDPGDLDVTPSLDRENLKELAMVLAEIDAQQYPDSPFGRWETRDDGEKRWVEFEPTEADRNERANWRPDPKDPDSFDHLLKTTHGALDVVPEIAGTYEDLRARATRLEVDGHPVWVESASDQLATLTVPRRAKDAERVRVLRSIQRDSSRE